MFSVNIVYRCLASLSELRRLRAQVWPCKVCTDTCTNDVSRFASSNRVYFFNISPLILLYVIRPRGAAAAATEKSTVKVQIVVPSRSRAVPRRYARSVETGFQFTSNRHDTIRIRLASAEIGFSVRDKRH